MRTLSDMFRTLLIVALVFGVPLRGWAASTLFPCAVMASASVMSQTMSAHDDMPVMMDMASTSHADKNDNGCMKMHGTACAFGAAVAPGPTYRADSAPKRNRIFVPDTLPPATLSLEQPERPPRVSA